MTDPINKAFLAASETARASAESMANRSPDKYTQLAEAQDLLRQAKVEIEKLRMSVDGERRVKLQYKNEAEALMEVNASLHRKLLNKPDWKLVLWLGGCIGCIVGSCVTLFFL